MSLIKNQLAKDLEVNLSKLKDLNNSYKLSYEKLKSLRKTLLYPNNSKQNMNQTLKTINKEYKTCQELCESRMNISNQSYSLLESELKKVNSVIERLELEQDTAKFNGFSYHNYFLDKNYDEIVNFDNYINQKKTKNKRTKAILRNLTIELPHTKHKELGKGRRGKVIKRTNLDNINSSNLEDITYREIDGKIGPKEPIYCFCNYVSYGNMIKCDNPKCEKEWFHFHCVGLRNLPKGKWFCSEKCANEYKKG